MRLSRRPYKASPGQSAYTLAELLVATFVLGVFVVSLYTGFCSGFAILRLSREEAKATQLVLQKLEDIRLCTWSQLSNFPRTFQQTYDPFALTNDPHATTFYGRVSLSDSEIAASYSTNLKLVTVTVFWTNWNGKQPLVHTNQMQTHVARYGMQNYEWGATP